MFVEKFVKLSTEENGFNPLYCISPPGYSYQCALNYTDIQLQTLQDKDFILFLEIKVRNGISGIMSDRYVKSDENKKIINKDATNFYGHSMSQMLLDDEVEIWHCHPDLYIISLEGLLKTPDDSDIGFFIEGDLKYPDNIKEKTKLFLEKYNDYMNKMKHKNYTKFKKIIYDWIGKKKYLIHFRMLKFYVRHGMVVEKIHEIVSFKKSKWLGNYLSFNTQKRIRAEKDFEKDFVKNLLMLLLVNF